MATAINILMIDDDEEDFIIVKDLFAQIPNYLFHVTWAASYNEGVNLITEKQHDLYLIDYRLGPDDGLELIREVIRGGCDVPLILLTGQTDIETDRQAMKAGASDYLVKGSISPSQLERAIRYNIERARNIREIKDLNSGLEKKVRDRTLELTNALEREQSISEMKSRFVSFASHEFRTPLAAILSSASLIRKYEEPEDAEKRQKHVDRIASSVKNLTEILDDFLSLAKLEKGVVEIERAEFNLQDFLENIVEEMDGMVGKKNQQINYRHEGATMIEQPKKLLKNILLNLLSNASKYSPEEQQIELTSVITGNKVYITVKDYGIGIPAEDHAKLFNEFFRAGNVQNIQGTGLGLNLVRRYIELLDGTICFTSNPGEGTTFAIEFPQIATR
ncbi:MAG: hybrid sensor histidine kinase/response regulator [Bacteroidetes bacterium]|nr:hybrid sensor histidine kinase/response regulator [Bacteroidota bacterium]